MYIVKIAYLDCNWKWQRDKTTPVSKEIADKIASLQGRYLMDMLLHNIIKDFMIETIAE